MRRIIVVSGPIAVGKSGVVSCLQTRLRAIRISTRELIQSLVRVPSSRVPLQIAGERLDVETEGRWVADAVEKRLRNLPEDSIVVIDSIRIPQQAEHLRARYGNELWHVHLTASEEVLERRFQKRKDASNDHPTVDEPETYAEAKANPTEARIASLQPIADVIVNTDILDPESATTKALEEFEPWPTSNQRLVDVVVGAQYGSEGKGNICDFLAPEYEVLVRVGGPNAGHRVADPPFDYVHLPSATLGNPKAEILIGAGATLNVVRLLREIWELGITPSRLSIDPQAIVIEQSDRDLEESLGNQIGSTKKGVGIATARKIVGRGGDALLGAKVRLVRNVEELKPFTRPVAYELERAYYQKKRILLEGTQGTDLSLHHGIYPSVTSRETTASGCLADAGIPPGRVDRVFMVTRTYPIRVGGKSGDMGIEIDFQTIADRSGVPLEEITATEIGTISKKPRRIAEFSWERVRRAAQLNGATDIVLTFADYLGIANRGAKTASDLTPETKDFIARLEKLTGVPVSIVATGFGRQHILDLRSKT